MKNISELNPYDLDEYLGPVWERETISKKVATPPPPVDPLPILNTIDLNVLKISDDEPVIETVIIHEYTSAVVWRGSLSIFYLLNFYASGIGLGRIQ